MKGMSVSTSEKVMDVATAATKKLPQITFVYWIIKVAVTTLGETGGDMFAQTLNIGYEVTSIALIAFFFVTLVVQMKSKSYHPMFYWAVILSTSMAGTTISDFMNRTLGLGYPMGVAILTSLLAGIFVVWHFSGHHFDISKINSFGGEMIFWSAILVSNTLGTSLGDFLSDSSGLGYAGGAALIAGALGLIVIAYYSKKVSHTFLFWAAFVLTRPLGATVGDFFSKPVEKGGLGLGTYGTSAVLLLIMIAGILYQNRQLKKDRIQTELAEPSAELAYAWAE